MSTSDISFEDLQTAVARRDPAFVQLFTSFLGQSDPPLPDDAPEGSISLYDLRYSTTTSWDIRRLSPGEERMHFRAQKWEAFRAQPFDPPPRLKLDGLCTSLYEEGGEWGRQVLLQLIATIPLKWGPWRAIKRIFKRAEQTHDFEFLGAIAVRCDVEVAKNNYDWQRDVGGGTLGYLRRRAWRYLRRLGRFLPDLYTNAAVQFLRWYPDFDGWYQESTWRKMWIGNHIFFHEHRRKGGGRYYGRTSFKYNSWSNKEPSDLAKHRAFPELWKESSAPVMDLLLLCRSERVAQFAIDVLFGEFKSEMRKLPLTQLIRLGQRPFGPIQRFVKELVEENPEWQKAKFKELGLHELVTEHFLFSRDEDVRAYAIAYSTDYASDLSFSAVLKLLNSEHYNLQEFARSLLSARDPREDIGLDGLQKMFLISASFELAQKLLKKGFRPGEIPIEWFQELLFSNDWSVINYATEFLEKQYPKDQVHVQWYQDLLTNPRIEEGYYGYMVRNYCQNNLVKHAAKLDAQWIKEALLNSDMTYSLQSWINDNKIKPKQLDLGWFKDLLDPAAWNKSDWVAQQQARTDSWIKDLSYPSSLKYFALETLRNDDIFNPKELGLDWLLGLLGQSSEDTREFSEGMLFSHYNPVDFADPEAVAALPEEDAAEAEAVENPFEGKSFLFTGKLSTLSRKEAQNKVAAIDGVVAKSVTKKLDFLVVGDDGSPLFSGGKKGSKLVKAESLQDEGLPIQIVSEADWLRMISEGSAAKADVDPRVAGLGFERLFGLATGEQVEEASRNFAIRYLRARHPVLGPKETGQPLEGEQVMPRQLYQARHFLPLFDDSRAEVQELAIQIGRYELRSWKVPPTDIFTLCESPHRLVRRFAIQALMGPPAKKDDSESGEDFYFPPEELDPDLVFALTENRRRDVRQAGIDLILVHYDLLGGDSRVLRLAESPDRDVRTQAVRALWSRYRRPSTSLHWQPRKDERSNIQPGASMDTLSDHGLLIDFVKAVLFGIPPGRLQKRPKHVARPWSNCKAKIHIIELVRDLALEDQDFYGHIQPIFEQFLASHHKTESLSCLVALTQLEERWQSA